MWKWIIAGTLGAIGMIIGELAPIAGEKLGGKLDAKKAIPEKVEDEDDDEEEEED